MQTPLAEQIDWYLTLMAGRPASPRTIRTYRSELRKLQHFAGMQGVYDAQHLTADVLVRSAADFMAEGARAVIADLPGTRTKGNEAAARTMVTAARGLNAALRKLRKLSVPDLAGVPTPSSPERLQPRVSLDDYEQMLRALDRREAYSRYPRFLLARDRALVQFLIETGMRAAEVARLNVADVDLTTGEVRINQAKARKARRLGILDPDDEAGDGGITVRQLRAYLAERPQKLRRTKQQALWIGPRGGRLSTSSLRAILRTLCEEAGTVNLPVHAFRRGWFTAAYRSEPRDLPILAARMGWSPNDTRMVAVYTRGAMLDFAALPRPLVTRCIVRESRGNL